MNAFSIIFIVVLCLLCVFEFVNLVRSILKKKNETKSQVQALEDFQSLKSDDINLNKED